MCPYHIVLADDHIMLRQGIKRMIEEVVDLKVVGEASDGLQLLNLLKKMTAHLVILDISMPNLRGIEATYELKRMSVEMKVLILTMYKDKELLYDCISAGADGYLLKEDTDTELFSAIKEIRQGGIYISPKLTGELTNDWVIACRRNLKPPFERLTTREREVLKLIAEGKSSREIADLLFISIRTAENHRANIMSKLGMRKAADLVRYAIREGYTSATP